MGEIIDSDPSVEQNEQEQPQESESDNDIQIVGAGGEHGKPRMGIGAIKGRKNVGRTLDHGKKEKDLVVETPKVQQESPAPPDSA